MTEGAWVVWGWSDGEVVYSIHNSEIEAFRAAQDLGYGGPTVSLVPWGANFHDFAFKRGDFAEKPEGAA